MKTPIDHAAGLMKKASNDLLAARAIFSTGAAMDMVCFHAQQAAEKSLKALLAVHDVEYAWRHDLGELMRQAASVWPEIAEYEPRLADLTPYAVSIRYDAEFEPSVLQAAEALETAELLYIRIQGIIDATKS